MRSGCWRRQDAQTKLAHAFFAVHRTSMGVPSPALSRTNASGASSPRRSAIDIDTQRARIDVARHPFAARPGSQCAIEHILATPAAKELHAIANRLRRETPVTPPADLGFREPSAAISSPSEISKLARPWKLVSEPCQIRARGASLCIPGRFLACHWKGEVGFSSLAPLSSLPFGFAGCLTGQPDTPLRGGGMSGFFVRVGWQCLVGCVRVCPAMSGHVRFSFAEPYPIVPHVNVSALLEGAHGPFERFSFRVQFCPV